MSFVSKSESDFLGQRRGAGGLTSSLSVNKHPPGVSRSRSSPHGATMTCSSGVRGDEEEYEGFSIISSEPLAGQCDSLPLPRGHGQRHRLGHGARNGIGGHISSSNTGQDYKVSISSKGSVSTPTSPLKASLVISPNSPFQKVGKGTDLETAESDQSSSETDSTVKSQEEKTPLDPQELAQKILEETQSHLKAMSTLQRGVAEGKAATVPASTPTRCSAFHSSETSAFSRPESSASIRDPAARPKPPSRSSSLQKISSGYSSPATSDTSMKEGGHPSPSLDSLGQFKLKYPSSLYSGHGACSPRNVSPSSGHQSPADSAPSPALSYSSTGSIGSGPTDGVELEHLRRVVIDEKVQTMHSLKTFWSNAAAKQQQQHTGALRGPALSTKKDVLGLLNLSPRRCSPGDGQDALELLKMGHPSLERTSSQGHNVQRAAPSPSISTRSSPGARPIHLPPGNGYKFLSSGRFFPSSKC